MIILLSPAKKMRDDFDMNYRNLPVLLDKTEEILRDLKTKSVPELKTIYRANDKIVEENYERIQAMRLNSRLTPAVLAYDGIAFKYMAPRVFTEEEFLYCEKHLRILSGFYGILRPMDGITPYRLEMGADYSVNGFKSLYEYFGDSIYKQMENEDVIINLASKEYSRCVEPYLTGKNRYITVDFVENADGHLVTRATLAKMARGAMVRYMAEHKVENPEELKGFTEFGFRFQSDLSTESVFVFEKLNKIS